MVVVVVGVVADSDALVEVRETRAFDLVEFLELFTQGFKLELRKVLMQIKGDVFARLTNDGVPVMTVIVLGIGQLRQDQLLLQSSHQYKIITIAHTRLHPSAYAESSQQQHKMKTVPPMFYGTAWKKERTAELVELALRKGFRAIDTACQPKHYSEQGVGEGVVRSKLPRDQLFLQTKFTPFDGQDPNNVPFNPKDPLEVQVQTSLEVSLKNLQTDYLDSLMLHSPLANLEKTMQVWRKFEQFVSEGRVRHLGISNCYSLPFFQQLYAAAKVKPVFLQNRFYADSNYDHILREYCLSNKVQYQSFWTLTANPHVLQAQSFRAIAQKYKLTPEQLFFATLMEEGIIPLTGTTSEQHMEEDLAVIGLKVEETDRKTIMGMLK